MTRASDFSRLSFSKAAVIIESESDVLSVVDDFISKLPREDRKHALEIIDELYAVFDVLKKKEHLRDDLRGEQRIKFLSIMKNADRLSASFNMLFQVFAKPKNSSRFVEHNEQFGFYEDGLAYLFLSESIATVLRTAELFKNSFLFVLKTAKNRSKDAFWSNMTLGQLLGQLDKITQGKTQLFAQWIDINLRNALTHGLFWLEGTVLVYCSDITLREQKRIIVSDLWIRARKQSVVTQCLISFIADWY